MKQYLYICLFLVLSTFSVKAEELVLSGTFQGDNLFVKNPFASNGVGFCVYEVTVNGQTTTDEINSSAFEVDLSVYGFSEGQQLMIAIKFKDDCQPLVLNPEVLNPRATFEVTKLAINNNNINWSTLKESGSLPFVIEQYRWNKWVSAGSVKGNGTPSANSYTSKLRLHSGDNRFRIKQTDYRGKIKYSEEIMCRSSEPAVTFTPPKADLALKFSAATMYEIYNEYGEIAFKGFGDSVNISSLKKGKYYINYDNTMDEFVKK